MKRKRQVSTCGPQKAAADYDVVIIGAGLSGLSAGYELRDLHTLVLEKNDYPGGRIRTCRKHYVHYELGALFAFNGELLPFHFRPTGLIRENGQVGIYHKGNLHYADSCLSCLYKAGMPVKELKGFLTAENYRFLSLSPRSLLNAFFRVIHPGRIEDTVHQRRQDALITFDTDHFETGNQEVIAALISESRLQVALNAEVTCVDDAGDYVKIAYRENGAERTVSAKTAILSAPAPAVLKTVKHISGTCRGFLKDLDYGRGAVVILGLKDITPDDFSYIVSTRGPVNTFFRHRTADPSIHVITSYYVGQAAKDIRHDKKEDIVSRTMSIFENIHPFRGPLSSEQLLFSDVHHWNEVGPLISEKSYKNWSEDCAAASARVFLCGDYQYVTPENPMPYGMNAAFLSGKQAAGKVKRFLQTRDKGTRHDVSHI